MQAFKVCLPTLTLGSASIRTRAEVAIGGTLMEPKDRGVNSPLAAAVTQKLGIYCSTRNSTFDIFILLKV